MQHVCAMLLISYSFKCEQHFVLCEVHIHALIVQTQENTILEYKVFTVEALETGHVSTPSSGSFSGRVHQYLCKT